MKEKGIHKVKGKLMGKGNRFFWDSITLRFRLYLGVLSGQVHMVQVYFLPF